MIFAQKRSCSSVPSSFLRFPFFPTFAPAARFGACSSYPLSLGAGGWISRFGLAATKSEALAVSVRRMVGTEVEGRRGADCFLEVDATGSAARGGGAATGVGDLNTGAGYEDRNL